MWRLVSHVQWNRKKSVLIWFLSYSLISRAAALNWRHIVGPKIDGLQQTLTSTHVNRSQYKTIVYLRVTYQTLNNQSRTQFNLTKETELQVSFLFFFFFLPLHVMMLTMFNVCSSMHNTVPFFLFGFWIFQMSKKTNIKVP